MNSNESTFRNITWGPLLIVIVGGLLFLLGAGRFVLRQNFGFIDALYCCLAAIPAGLLLLVISYVVQHAKLVSVIPIFLAVVLSVSYPAFDVALGLALMGAVADTALSDRKCEEALRSSTNAREGKNEERK